MGDVPGAEDEGTGSRLYRLLADVEGHLALEDVEGLVLLAVKVERGSCPFGFEDLNDRVEVTRLLACGLYGGKTAGPPPRVPLAVLKPEDPLGDPLFVHLLLLSLDPAGPVPGRAYNG